MKPPEICAPRCARRSRRGSRAKLMIGRVLTSLSRTTAKWPESAAACSALTGPIACAWPRWAIWRVTSWKASRPFSVNSKVTFGWLLWSVFCFGSVMSVPESAGRSLSAIPAGLRRLVGLPGAFGRQFGDEHGPGGHFDHDPVAGTFLTGRADVEVLLGVFGPGDQLVRRLALEEVVARPGGRAGCRSWRPGAVGGQQGGVVGGREGAVVDQLPILRAVEGVAPGRFPFLFAFFSAAGGRLLAGMPADRLLGADQVRLPVIEVELRGRPDRVQSPAGRW